MELGAVEVPGEGLAGPDAGAAVPDGAPRVPALVGHADGAADAVGLVARAARVHVAVDGAVARQLPVDRLHDVDLAAPRPRHAVAHRVPQQPERRPDALLVVDAVVAEAEARLCHGPRAGRRRERVRGLDARRCPLPAAVLARHDLHGGSAAELQVLARRRVGLPLVVDFEAGDYVPVVAVH